jgi:hypothetical protein
MIENKAITYSLLAHIRNSGSFIDGPLDIFVPLIKRVLHKLSEEGYSKSENLTPILKKAQEQYNIDFPIPVIKIILTKISIELNSDERNVFKLHSDGSYILQQFVFEDYEEKIQNSAKEVEKIEVLFKEFCNVNNLQVSDNASVFDFIDKNRYILSKYFSNKSLSNGHDYTVEAKFVDYFKNSPQVYEMIRNIYLGSILTCYIEFKTEALNIDVELLLDTNFIISLLDLNTEESTHTCNKLLEICKNLGYKFSILNDTIAEIRALLKVKINYFDQTFLQKRINQEDIYNACERRKLSIADLERIVDNIEELIVSKGIRTIYDTTTYKNKAKFSREFEYLKSIRNSETAALHDATALYYVKEKRGKKTKDFERVNCWFVNNSISHDTHIVKENNNDQKDFQPIIIKADELLNILWLSSPQVTSKITDNDLVDIGLSSIVAFTLNESLPKAQIIRELDENINKYGKESLTTRDIVFISNRIVNKQLKNLDELNKIAHTDSDSFIKRLHEEANKQELEEKQRTAKFEELFQSFEKNNEILTYKNREADELIKKAKEATTSTSYKITEIQDLLKQTNVEKQQLQEDNERKRTLCLNLYFL